MGRALRGGLSRIAFGQKPFTSWRPRRRRRKCDKAAALAGAPIYPGARLEAEGG